MSQREFHRLSDLLFLHVKTTDIRVRDIRLLMFTEHGDRRVRLRRKDVDKGVGVAVQCNGRGWLQFLAVERGENSHNVIRARGRLYDAGAVPVSVCQ